MAKKAGKPSNRQAKGRSEVRKETRKSPGKKTNDFKKAYAMSAKGKPAKTKTPAKAAPKAHPKSPVKGPVKVPLKAAKPSPKAEPQKAQAKGAPVKPVLAPVGKTEKPKKAGGAKASAAALALAHAEKMCREGGCENLATTKGYCRLDYIKNWKKIKRKEMILKEGKLNQYIEELVSKYPDKYIEVIRQDLSTEVNFTKVIHDLELDESIDDLDYDGDSIDSLIGSIRKEDEDFGDSEF